MTFFHQRKPYQHTVLIYSKSDSIALFVQHVHKAEYFTFLITHKPGISMLKFIQVSICQIVNTLLYRIFIKQGSKLQFKIKEVELFMFHTKL